MKLVWICRDEYRGEMRVKQIRQILLKATLGVPAAIFALALLSIAYGVESLYFEYELAGKKLRHEYVLGTIPVDIPNIPLPQKGESYQDPIFGCKVTRISDKEIDGYHSKRMVNIYSTLDVENCDGTLLMLGSFNYYMYDARTFKMLKHMGVQPRWGYEWEARWHPTKSNLLFYVWDTQLRMRDVSGPSKVVSEDILVHDFKKEFPDAKKIGVAVKGTPSINGRFWVFGVSIPTIGSKHGFDRALFYDIDEDKVLGVVECGNPKWVGTSMSGDYMIVAGNLPGRKRGVWALRRDDPTKVVKLAPSVTHGDLAINSDGNEVYVYENSETDYVEMSELATGKTTKLISLIHHTTWKELRAAGGIGQHFSGNCWNTPGWILVSTYSGPPRDPSVRCWKKQLHYMLELRENPRIWGLCHNRSVQGGYWAAAFATINARGTRAFWGANWGDPNGRLEVYTVELPDNWHEELMGKSGSAELKRKARKTLHLE